MLQETRAVSFQHAPACGFRFQPSAFRSETKARSLRAPCDGAQVSFARSSTVWYRTPAPASQSSLELHSSGLWLTPSLERTKIMPIGQRSTSCIPSCAAPLASAKGLNPSARQALSAASLTTSEQGAGSIRCSTSV